MTYVPVVLRAQSIYLLLIGQRGIVFAHFVAKIASIKLRTSAFKPNERGRFRFEATSLLSGVK